MAEDRRIKNEPSLYAQADGGRKPWFIAALVYHEGAKHEERFVSICHSREEATKWLSGYRKERGLNDCHYYIAEGFYNITG